MIQIESDVSEEWDSRTDWPSIETHASHLVVHGTLHLLGYDHETSDADAELMEETERRALASMGISDPYLVTETSS